MSAKLPDNSPDDDKDIPDDFFNDLADSKYLDELLSNQVDADSQEEIRNAAAADDGFEASANKMDVESGGTSPAGSGDNDSPASPLMERCLREIDKLTKDIQKKKKKLQKELEEKEREKRDRSESPTPLQPCDKPPLPQRRRNRSRSIERYGRRRKSRSPRRRSRSPRRRSRSRSRGRSTRYARSRSPTRRTTGSPIKPSMTFLEELDKKFAEQGQAFPEKDLMLKMQAHHGKGEQHDAGMPGPSSAHRMNIPFGVAQPMRYPAAAPPQPPPQMEMFPPGVGPVYGSTGLLPDPSMQFRYAAPVNFGLNPMAIRMGGFVPVAAPYAEPVPPTPGVHMMQPEPRQQTLTEVNHVMQVGWHSDLISKLFFLCGRIGQRGRRNEH